MLIHVALAAIAAAQVRLMQMPSLRRASGSARPERESFTWDKVDPEIPFDQIVPSWNLDHADGVLVEVQIRAHGNGFDSKWYSFGKWSLDDPNQRESVKKQGDENGDVDTDTFVARKPVKNVDIRISLSREKGIPEHCLKLFTLSFADTKHSTPSEANPSGAWGKTIEVPQRAQGNYPNGAVLCSPTSLSMVLWHYANKLNRPELNRDVPEVESHVWDKVYKGAGNWPFNAAYAGSFTGMRGYVARFRSIADLEKWIDAGLPVICSISLDLAEGKPADSGTGHLVVLVGFTSTGDPVFNDPARKSQVRYTYSRANFERAWLFSHRTVYLVYPETAQVPEDGDRVWLPTP